MEGEQKEIVDKPNKEIRSLQKEMKGEPKEIWIRRISQLNPESIVEENDQRRSNQTEGHHLEGEPKEIVNRPTIFGDKV